MTRERTRRLAIVAVALLALGLAACSSDEGDTGGGGGGGDTTGVQGTVSAAKAAACVVVNEVSSALGSASSDGGTQLAANAESLANNLNTAAGTLESTGAEGEIVQGMRTLATELQSIATSTPETVQSAAAQAQDELEELSSTLGC